MAGQGSIWNRSLRGKVEDAAGVGQMLPESFAAAYEALFVGTFRDGDVDGGGSGGRSSHAMSGRGEELGKATGKVGESGRARRVREHTGQVDVVGTKVKSGSGRSGGGKDNRKTSNQLRNERLLREKVKIDKRLRSLGREIVAILEGVKDDGEGQRRCGSKCGRLGQNDWLFCPNCGGPMVDVARTGAGA